MQEYVTPMPCVLILTCHFFPPSLLLSSSTPRRFSPQRFSRQAEVTGVVPSAPRYVGTPGWSARMQISTHFSSIDVPWEISRNQPPNISRTNCCKASKHLPWYTIQFRQTVKCALNWGPFTVGLPSRVLWTAVVHRYHSGHSARIKIHTVIDVTSRPRWQFLGE